MSSESLFLGLENESWPQAKQDEAPLRVEGLLLKDITCYLKKAKQLLIAELEQISNLMSLRKNHTQRRNAVIMRIDTFTVCLSLLFYVL